MRLVLVNPPKTNHERAEIAPPLGLLRIAEAAIHAGASVAIEDYNLLYHLLPELRSDFYQAATERLLSLAADFYGFTSMAVDSHVALELARRLKQARPDCSTLFGGPHFSSAADQFQLRYPWVDHIVKGDGELRVQQLISPLTGNDKLVVLGAQDSLRVPRSAYSLVDLGAYFYVNPNRVFNYEPNRGCRYKCTFCYSPGFYGAALDLEVDKVVADLALLKSYGAKRVFFVGDNLINNRKWVIALCSALHGANLGLDWYCYATLPDFDVELAQQMAEAGCSQVFMGIDVVGATSEKQFHKAFTRRESDLERKIRAIREAGISAPTCGFILCPPSHPGSKDWMTTIQAALATRRAGAEILFNVLNIYAGTEAEQNSPVHRTADALQTELLLDVPPVVQRNSYAPTNPGGFPFHSRYVPEDEWNGFLRMAHCLHTLVNLFPDELTTLIEKRRMTPVELAQMVVARTGELLAIQPEERRSREAREASHLFKHMKINDLSASPGGRISAFRQESW